MVYLAMDVQYRNGAGLAAGVAFSGWNAAKPLAQYLVSCGRMVAYAPGQFCKRELPCLLHLLEAVPCRPDCLIVDGSVFLDDAGRPGVGKYLHDALNQEVAVVGVAKTAFAGLGSACEVLRGGSLRPLYVTSVGMSPEEAQAGVASMYGEARIPLLLRQVDRLCRSAARDSHPVNAQTGG